MPSDLPLIPGLFATPYRFLWHADSRTAILADLHLGIEASLARQGLYLPAINEALHAAWEHLLKREPKHVIIAGDLFDSPQPDDRAQTTARELLRQLPTNCRLTLTSGNHDPETDSLVKILHPHPISIQSEIVTNGLLISHGHEIPPVLSTQHSSLVWIVGHQHPAVTVANRVQSAKMTCYALCEIGKGRRIVLLPAFSHAPLGCNLLTARHWLLPISKPPDAQIRIAGLIEPNAQPPPLPPPPQVLDFGPLAGLSAIG